MRPKDRFYLVRQLVRREVDAQFKGTIFGFLWAFARPLLMLAVYTFVFGVIFRRDVDGEPLGSYAVSMFCGLAIFNIFSTSITSACGSVVNRRGYVQQVVFPLTVLPLVQVLAMFILSLPWFILLFTGVLCVHGTLYWTCLFVPLWLVVLFLLTQGFAWLVASLGVYFRDIKQFVPIVLQIMFFLTPIFWRLDPITARHPEVAFYLRMNPLTTIIEEMRHLIFCGENLNWMRFASLLVVSILVFLLGYVWFNKTKKGFADVI